MTYVAWFALLVLLYCIEGEVTRIRQVLVRIAEALEKSK